MSGEEQQAQAAQTPLWDLLRGVPKDRILEVEMKDTEGKVYGHQMIPIGLYSHEAADQLESAAFYKKRMKDIVESFQIAVGRGG